MAYIDKSRAIGMLERFREEHSNLPNVCLKMIDIALNIIKQIPTADVDEIKAEAIKEFAERLKNKSEDCTDWGDEFVLCEDIDDLVKELVGEA